MMSFLNTLSEELRDKLIATQANMVRKTRFPDIPNKIHIAIGMRRTGKTCLMLQTIRNITQEQHISLERCLHLNFEDDRLLPCTEEKLARLLEAFYECHPDNHHQVCYIFLDEIQNVDNWASVIRRFFDTKKVQLYLSGSSAKLLSKEIATALRGRAIATEVWPYCFAEYLDVSGQAAHLVSLNLYRGSQAWHDHYFSLLKTYLQCGGFPEIFQIPTIYHRQLLQDYIEVVIMRDIVERHHITQISLIKYIIQFLLKNAGCLFSVNKLANDIKSQGMSGSKNTIYDYLGYIEDTYLAFSVPLFSESLRKVHSNPRKIYAIDAGLVRAVSFSLHENHGHLFENLIFLDLKRKGHKIFYYLTQERYEVDFLTEDALGIRRLYQVVWDDSDLSTAEREQRALEKAKVELGIEDTTYIITPKNYMDFIEDKLKPATFATL